MTSQLGIHDLKLKLRLATPILVILCSFCLATPRAVAAQGTQRYDSAGVQIVSNHRPLWASSEKWRLSSDPVLQIGTASGPREFEFFGISGITRLPDGVLVVANSGASELRFYGSDGAFIRTVGRRGSGPGEYVSLRLLPNFHDDSLLVYDRDLSRLSTLTPSGEFVRSVQIAPPQQFNTGLAIFGHVIGKMSDGRILIQESSSLSPSGPGLYRQAWEYVLQDTTGSMADTIGPLPGDQIMVKEYGGRPVFSNLPFLQKAFVRAGGDRLLYGDTESFEVRIVDLSGRLLQVIRKSHRSQRLPREAYDIWVENQLDSVPNEQARRATAEYYAELYQPWVLPAFSNVLFDRSGYLWVEEFHAPYSRQPSTWNVFDQGGALLGTIQMPPRFTVFEIGIDYVLGRRLGEYDVEYVEVYELIR